MKLLKERSSHHSSGVANASNVKAFLSFGNQFMDDFNEVRHDFYSDVLDSKWVDARRRLSILCAYERASRHVLYYRRFGGLKYRLHVKVSCRHHMQKLARLIINRGLDVSPSPLLGGKMMLTKPYKIKDLRDSDVPYPNRVGLT